MWVGMLLFVAASTYGDVARRVRMNAEVTTVFAFRSDELSTEMAGEEAVDGDSGPQGTSCCYLGNACMVAGQCPQGSVPGPCPCREPA